MERPLIPLLIALIAGITAGNIVHLPDIVAVLLFLIFFIVFSLSIIKKWKRYIVCSLILSLFFLGVLNINLYLYQKPRNTDISLHTGKDKLTIEGLICKNPRVFPHKTFLVVSTTKIIKNGGSIPVNGKILLSVRHNKQHFKYGDFIRAKTRLKKPHNFNNPGGFDYERYLLYRGIKVRGYIDNSAKIVIIRRNIGNIFKIHLENFRTSIRKLFSTTSPNYEGEILQALILGEKGGIPEDILENFKRTGISHVLAISGLHIGIIAFLSLILVKTCMKSSEYLLLRFNIFKISLLFATIPIIIYAFIAGLGISTIRATIMILTFLLSVLLDRERDILNTVALVAFIILIIAPASLFDVSFQLSFAAVTAIVIITPRFSIFIPKWNAEENEPPSLKRKITLNIMLFIIVSLAATLGTLPLIAFYFNRLSTVTLLSNIMIIPIIGFVVLPLGLLTIVIAPVISPLAIIFIKIASFFAGISVSIINFLASFSFSSIFVTTPTLIEIMAYYLTLMTSVKLIDIWTETNRPTPTSSTRQIPLNLPLENEGIKRFPDENLINKRVIKYRILKISFALLILFFMADGGYLYMKGKSTGHLKATFIDVGQGSSTLIEFPGGKKMLVDGGGFYDTDSFDIGKCVVAPFLWHERIKKIDIVVLTHPDQDHIGGLIYILKNFKIKEVWSNGQKSNRKSYLDFLKIIKEKNIPHRIISGNTPEIKIGNTSVKILNPVKSIPEGGSLIPEFDFNNNGIVMKIIFGDVSILLPADISGIVENNLILSGDNLRSNILMAPHHGAYTSSTIPFLRMVRPEISVFSCGPDNVFGFPDPDVLDRYGKIDTKIFRTDKNGAITIKTNGKNVKTRCQISDVRDMS